MFRMPRITNNYDPTSARLGYNHGRKQALDVQHQNNEVRLGGYLAGGKPGEGANFALQNGMLNEGMKLKATQQKSAAAEEQRKADHMARVAFVADTPEKWGRMVGALQNTGTNLPEQYHNFGSRDSVLAEHASLSDLRNIKNDRRADQTLGLRREALSLKKQKLAMERAGGRSTPAMRNLKAAGVKPGSPEYRNAILGTLKRGPTINNIAGSGKGTNKLNEKLAEQAAGVFDQASAAQDLAGKYNQIAQLAKDPNVRTGTLGGVELAIKKFGNTVIGAEFDGLPEAEQIGKIGKILIGDIRKMVGDTRMSDADRRVYASIPPNIGDSKAGIVMAAELMRQTANGMTLRQQKLSDLITANNGLFDTNVASNYHKYIRETPLVKRESIFKARRLAKEAKEPGVGAGMQRLLNKYGVD